MLKPSLKVLLSLSLFFLPVYCSVTFAAAPDAGSIMNQQQQMQQTLPERVEPQDSVKTNEKKTEVPATDGKKVLVKSFKFTGIEGVANGGVGVNISNSNSCNIRVSYAHAMRKNDGRNINEANVDNKSDKGQFWIQAVARF
jgi:hypothetical protein